jgi:CRISPR-associated protein Csx10
MSGSLASSFLVTVRLLSDWHVGTGDGRVAAVDAQVRRDSEGLPFVPAKTLVGLWRDACETVASAFDDAGGSAWQAWVDWLFGSQPTRTGDLTVAAQGAPWPAAIAVTPARLPSVVGNAVAGRPALAASMVLLRPAVALEEPRPGELETGTAADEALRLEERARGGVALVARCTAEKTRLPDGAGTFPAAAELLLRAGAELLDRLGGKRQRGAGRCRVELPGGHGRLCELLDDSTLLGAPGPPPDLLPGPSVLAAAGPPRTGTRSYRVALDVRTPVVAQDRVIGNVVVSLPFVPGTMLMRAVLPRLRRPGGLGYQDVRVGDARVAAAGHNGEIRPGRPAPMVWQRPKDRHQVQLVNAAITAPDRALRYKGLRGGDIIEGADGTVQLVHVPLVPGTHAVIDDIRRRPTSEGGGVFSVLGIRPGTLLAFDLIVPADAILDLAAGTELALGRSRKDDYGQVTIRSVAELDPDDPVPASPDGLLRVWCVSQVLIRDDRLAPDPTPQGLARLLSARLDLGKDGLTVVGPARDGTEPTCARVSRRESSQARWGRPRPSLVGLAAGSVVTLQVADGVTLDLAALAAVERAGLGERTAEGFGAIRFNPAEVTSPELPPLAAADEVTMASAAAPGDPEEAQLDVAGSLAVIEASAWRAAIARSVAVTAADPDSAIRNISRVTSRTQRAALLQQVERLGLADGRPMVDAWFTATRQVTRRARAWAADGAAGPGPLDDARALLLDEPGLVWRRLQLDGPQPGLVTAPGREDGLRSELWLEAVTALVSAVLRSVRQREPREALDGA